MLGKAIKKIRKAGKSAARAVKNVVSPKIPKPKTPKPSAAETAVEATVDAQSASDKGRREADASSAFKGLLGARAFLGGSGFGGFLK